MGTDLDKYRTGRHVVYDLNAHIVLVTKYRRGAITDRVREVIVSTSSQVCERLGAELIEKDGEDDHIHLLVAYPPKLSLSSLVMSIKTLTSKRVREQSFPEVTSRLWGEHFWSPSYFVVSTGGAPLDRVAEYIRDQRKPSRGPGRPPR